MNRTNVSSVRARSGRTVWPTRCTSAAFWLALCTTCGPTVSPLGHTSANGAPLFQRSIVMDRSTNVFTSDRFDLDLVLTDAFFAPTRVLTLFDALEITPADIGTTFVADASNEPNFAAAAAQLANNVDEFIRFKLMELKSGRAEQQGWFESGFFLGLSTPTKPDLNGQQIGSIELVIDQFVLAAGNAPSTAGQAVAPPVQLMATLRFMGVPEPSSVLLGGSALLGLLGTGWRNRRTP